VKIIDLAKRYARLRGKILRDEDIRIVGKRPEEKLREELVEEGEQTSPTAHSLIININSSDDLGEDFIKSVDELYEIVLARNSSLIKAKLKDVDFSFLSSLAWVKVLKKRRRMAKRN
jgi:FlaA1/EpsC-like NDP-sugar epimerase